MEPWIDVGEEGGLEPLPPYSQQIFQPQEPAVPHLPVFLV
jgi:hypothetical protein